MKTSRAAALLLAFAFLPLAAVADAYPPLQPYPGDTSQWGEHIQRTMGLLAESTSTNRNAVKILFYGQSIIGGKYHAWVERGLRDRFPHADLTVENRALGGFSSQYLLRTVTHDVLVSEPDLVVFSVSGDHVLYEQIIHTIRSRTAAEVMIVSRHWRRGDLKEDGSWTFESWTEFVDKFLPFLATAYHCEFVDVRWPWKEYLIANDLKPGDLLLDDIHLNDHGRRLMGELCLRQMVYRPELMTEVSASLAKDYRVGEEVAWNGRELRLPFTGSRVEVLAEHAGGAACEVLIDGVPPSAIPEVTLHSRTTSIAEPYEWPSIQQVDFETIPEPQLWTLTLTEVDPASREVAFSLAGSRTGDEGAGSSTNRFVARSGQVVIEPQDWIIRRKGNSLKEGKIQPGMQVRWTSFRLAPDYYLPSALLERDRPVVTTIVSGLRNTAHTLVLKSDGVPPPFHTIRVYTPAIPDGPFTDLGLAPGDARLDETGIHSPTPLE